MKEIGGYFGLEIKAYNNFPLDKGVLLNSGRAAFEYILSTLPAISKIHIPYFTCDAILEPLNKLNIKHCFYSINENLEIADEISLAKTEYLLYTNYFGIKEKYANSLVEIFGKNLILDNAQALFSVAPENTNTFYSPRKFVGLPDGGLAITSKESKTPLKTDLSYNRCSHLLKRIEKGAEFGYADFKENSAQLKNSGPKSMSKLTRSLISGIDFEYVKEKRKKNFSFLHKHLQETNLLKIEISSEECPMVYPYLTTDSGLRKKLISKKIFVPTYWPNVFNWCEESQTEYELSKFIIPLPIDQRYQLADMKHIVEQINLLIKFQR